MDDASDVYGW
ncbi:hypothetical protein CGLO_18125 [Colletotrichum gloeosporioides Cg-14]|uniref:Uncharacterized protein n=1 Tax=Colletotrichum gloeosporioides (strain Cg-14) TaxID=1237896 RepID=T0JV32_COLGC|nr:hypothetical protein CGLO_18125 [Colletotrichum gloeosporioides Cg-14]